MTPATPRPDPTAVPPGRADARRRIALLTGSPWMLLPLVGDEALQRELGIEIPLVVWVRPSMKWRDRVRDLHRTILRRARLTGIAPALQLVHYLGYRWVLGRGSGPAAADRLALGAGRRLVDALSANDPGVASALRAERCALGLVFGTDVLSRATLAAIDLPLFNIHLSDPAFVRDLPPFFWEILAGRDACRMTLHRLTAAIDSGPIVAQTDVPIDWQRTLRATLKRTADRCGAELAHLLAAGLPPLLDGTAQARPVVAGPLRTTPTLRELRRAAAMCRERAARRVDEGRSDAV